MSMNHREIDQVLEEVQGQGTHVQQVWQIGFDAFALDLLRSDDSTLRLWLCTRPGYTRIHRTSRTIGAKVAQARFGVFLRARLKSAYVERIFQHGHERIVVFQCRKEGEPVWLLARLWGTAGNLFYCTGDYPENLTIVDAAFRRPARGETSGELLTLPPVQDSAKAFSIRPWEAYPDLNSALDQYYQAQEREERHRHVKAQAERALGAFEAKVRARIGSLESQLANLEKAETYKHYGDLVASVAWSLTPGSTEIEVEDWNEPGTLVRLALDPALTAHQNAQKWYQKYQKARDSQDWVMNSMMEQERLLAAQTSLQSSFLADDNLPNLQRILGEIQALVPKRQTLDPDNQTLGARFIRHGFTVIVGRSAQENDDLLRHGVRGNDLWLHARDWPGAYVFIKMPRDKTPPLDLLLDAAHLAVWYSKGKEASQADCYYTRVKYLRRAKDGPKGLVLPTQEKNILVKIDPQRLKDILGQ